MLGQYPTSGRPATRSRMFAAAVSADWGSSRETYRCGRSPRDRSQFLARPRRHAGQWRYRTNRTPARVPTGNDGVRRSGDHPRGYRPGLSTNVALTAGPRWPPVQATSHRRSARSRRRSAVPAVALISVSVASDRFPLEELPKASTNGKVKARARDCRPRRTRCTRSRSTQARSDSRPVPFA